MIGNVPSANAVASGEMQPPVMPQATVRSSIPVQPRSTVKPQPSVVPTATVKPQPSVVPTATVKPSQTDLRHAATGTADWVWDAKKQTLDVRITMNGLAPNSTAHVADISQGSCLTGGKQLAVLNPIVPTKPPKKARKFFKDDTL